MSKQTVGEFMALLRKAAGLTQQEVAEKLNISNRTLSSWETDRTAPDILMLPTIAELYGITVDELLNGGEIKEKLPKVAEVKNNPLKVSFLKFSEKRIKLTLLLIFCAAVVFTGCIVFLYSPTPLWVDVLLIAAGVIANAAVIPLLFKYENRALREGEGGTAFALALRNKTALSLVYNGLAYLIGVVILAICYYEADGQFYNNLTGYVYAFYDACTAVAISICAVLAVALILAGILNNLLYLSCSGNSEQKANLKHNLKLLKKLSTFGLIPVGLSLVAFIAFSNIKFSEINGVFFTANSVDEVYQNFQTITFYSDQKYLDEKTDEITVITQGEYFLNFQSENHIQSNECNFYDIGNGFYANYDYEWAYVYYLKVGVSVEEIDPKLDHENYLLYTEKVAKKIYFTSPDGETLSAFSFYIDDDYVYYGNVYNVSDKFVLSRDGETYTYQRINYYDYSPLVFLIFIGTTAATVLTCTAIHLIKRKKQDYGF